MDTRTSPIWVAFVVFFGLGVVACGDEEPGEVQQNDINANVGEDNDDPTDAHCIPGEARACVCEDGATGSQICAEDGEGYEPCRCTDDLAAPEGLTATSGEYDDRVVLNWEAVEEAVEYRIYRDNVHVATVNATSYDDTGADSGSLPEAPQLEASQGDYEDVVILEWDEPAVKDGSVHDYEIVATDHNDFSPPSESTQGYRSAADIETYELEIDGGDWFDVGETTTYEDEEVDEPSVAPGEVDASEGESLDYIEVDLPEATAEPGGAVDYRVRAINQQGAGESSELISGYTGFEGLSVQWERSAGDEDADYAEIPGATDFTYQDEDAPFEGEGRYYRAVVSPQGADEPVETTEPARGFRAVEPKIQTVRVDDVGHISATFDGGLSVVGAPAVKEHGFCYGTSSDPSPSDAECIELGERSEFGMFSATATDLEGEKTYYVRAFGRHPHLGDYFGDNVKFSTESCGAGTIEGTSCTPSTAPWPGAEVTVEGTDCQGESFEKTTTAGADGFFEFDEVDAGGHDLTISSGSFEVQDQVVTDYDQVSDLTVGSGEPRCLESDEVSIAVLSGPFDAIDDFLDDRGFEYEKYSLTGEIEDLLTDYDAMEDYDIIVAESGTSAFGAMDEGQKAKENLADYIEEGQSLYASGLADDLLEESVPEAFDFADSTGSAQSVAADVVDPYFENAVGGEIDIFFSISGLSFIDSVGDDSFVYFEADLAISPDEVHEDGVIGATYAPSDGGRAVFSALYYDHDEEDNDNGLAVGLMFFEL